MANNVEGESLKRMSGASAKPGGVSNVVKAMFAEKWLRGSNSGGGSGGKTAADWENEEVSKQHDFRRDQSSKTRDVSRTVKLAKANRDEKLGIKGHQSADHRVDLYAQTGTRRQKPAADAKSSNGQGTSGNKPGAQFKNTVAEVAKDVVATGVGAVTGAAVGAATRNPKAATAAGTLATEGTKAVINKVSQRGRGKSSAV